LIKLLGTYEEIVEYLRHKLRKDPVIIVGVGNELRRDDGFGTYLARALTKYLSRFMVKREIHIVDAGNAPELYTDIISRGRDGTVLIVDALLVEGVEPGNVLALDINLDQIGDEDLTEIFTTHALGLRTLMRVAGVKYVSLLGTVPYSIEFGLGLTEPVAKAFKLVFKAMTYVLNELGFTVVPEGF